jgi:type I restriction enzyme S subunit
MAMNQSCYALKGKELPQLFLFCSLASAVEQFRSRAAGAVFDAIVVDTFKLIPFVVPDPVLVKMFEDYVRPIFDQTNALLLQNQALRKARDILLPRLMSESIVV